MILNDANITPMLVRNTIGYPSTSVGDLCGAGEPYINKWARFKPVVNDYDPLQGRPSDWWKGNPEKNCGIRYKVYRTLRELLNNITSGEDPYQYVVPYGGASSPFRLGDFRKYDTDARPPLSIGYIDGSEYSTDDTNISIAAYAGKERETSLSFKDVYSGNFASLNNLYYGVAMQNVNFPSTIKWKTSTGSFYAGDKITLNFPIDTLGEGSWYVYQFLTDVYFPNVQTDLSKAGKFVPFPISSIASNKQRIRIASSFIFVKIAANFTPQQGFDDAVLEGDILVTNNTGSQQTYNGNRLEWWYWIKDRPEPWVLKPGEGYGEIPNFTVPPRTNQYRQHFRFSSLTMLKDVERYGGSILLIFKANGSEIARGTVFVPRLPQVNNV